MALKQEVFLGTFYSLQTVVRIQLTIPEISSTSTPLAIFIFTPSYKAKTLLHSAEYYGLI